MKDEMPGEDGYCRLSRAIIDKHGCSYHEALRMLGGFHLNLVCDEKIRDSVSLQAALLTAINAGKRSFLGGVSVSLPSRVENLVPWPSAGSLNDLAIEFGATLQPPVFSQTSHTLYFGNTADPVEDGLKIICSGWRGGVVPANQPVSMEGLHDFALGGVMAGALGVAKGFLRVSGLSSRFVDEPQGLSLWRPDLDWLIPKADGPALEILPQNLWFLGLGHLGQAFAWNLGLLPYSRMNPATVFLQDFDRVVAANWNAGLLCAEKAAGEYKTRLCSRWLEARGFKTRLIEREFNELTRRNGDEPYIALCGFDNVKSRTLLEDAGFDLIVECGLGGDTQNFDDIVMHTFPDASQAARDIWKDGAIGIDGSGANRLAKAFHNVQDCGILIRTLESKAVSTSFVGAFAGALVIGELLRGLHGGLRCELLKAQLRSNDSHGVVLVDEIYQNRFGKSGYVSVADVGNLT